MIIKRYSQKQFTFTGRDLVEKLYSEGWKVEQKEYGLKSAAISGIKKVGKLIAKKLDDSSKLDSEKLKKINESLKSVAKDRNPEVLKLLKAAGASKDELKNAKEELDLSLKTYKIGRNKAIKDSISKRLKGFKKTKTM